MQKTRKITMIYLLAAMIAAATPLHADQCDDLHATAEEALAGVTQAEEQKDYRAIVDIYNQVADYYTQIENNGNCGNSGLQNAAPKKALFYQDAANKLAADIEAKQQYDLAEEQYNQGSEYLKNNDWGMAIVSFEGAIAAWDMIAEQHPESQTGRAALKSARMARASADQARLYQRNNVE